MRQYAYLAAPLDQEGQHITKIMLYETKADGTYVFLYDSPQAQFCAADEWYESTEAALAQWQPLVDAKGWIPLGDPLPDCQDDAFLPIRIKGRNTGTPQWGQYEILTDKGWAEYRA